MTQAVLPSTANRLLGRLFDAWQASPNFLLVAVLWPHDGRNLFKAATNPNDLAPSPFAYANRLPLACLTVAVPLVSYLPGAVLLTRQSAAAIGRQAAIAKVVAVTRPRLLTLVMMVATCVLSLVPMLQLTLNRARRNRPSLLIPPAYRHAFAFKLIEQGPVKLALVPVSLSAQETWPLSLQPALAAYESVSVLRSRPPLPNINLRRPIERARALRFPLALTQLLA